MNILYTTNSKFVGKVAASMCSVFENNKDMEQIVVYIVGQNLSEDECEKFNYLGEKYHRGIVIIELGDINSYFDFEFDTNGWNSIVLARLILDRVLPEDVDKVLYLDGDTVNIAPLSDLWKTDMKGCVIGACIEATVDFSRRCALGMETIPYINAGVLLIDLKLWKLKQTGRRILEYYQAHDGNLFANDQDAINGALKNQIYYLPPKYNYYNIYWFYTYNTLQCLMKKAYYYSREVFDESRRNPAIIHYLGEERPWRAGNKHKYKMFYKKYLNMTPWRGEKDEEGWRVYFVCWNFFNFMMRPFPKLRYKIINGLIPAFMKWRKKQLKKGKR